MAQERPTGLKSNKGIELLTFGTPNGHKASIMLEELKEAYGKLEYTVQNINIMQNIQKEPWFTKLGPNGRIPVIVDHDRNSFPVQETVAILTYLARHYDPEHRLSYDSTTDPDNFSRVEQWLAWGQGGLGPMQGQAGHFFRLGPERIPYPTQRYIGEVERLYGILDKQLEGRDFLVGEGKGKYSIADISIFPWVNHSRFGGLDLTKFKNLEAWTQRINERPAVKKGVAVPNQSPIVNEAFNKKLESDQEAREKEKKLEDLRAKAQEQYNYKYSSP